MPGVHHKHIEGNIVIIIYTLGRYLLYRYRTVQQQSIRESIFSCHIVKLLFFLFFKQIKTQKNMAFQISLWSAEI